MRPLELDLMAAYAQARDDMIAELRRSAREGLVPEQVVERVLADELAVLKRENFGIVQKAARDGTWQAAAWILERRFPDRWARRRPRNGTPVHITTDRVTIRQDQERAQR